MTKMNGPHSMDFRKKEEIESFQLKKIRELLRYAYASSVFYKKIFKKNRLHPEKIKSLKDFQRFPVTTKEDLRSANREFFCAARDEWADLFATSGTTGRSVYFPYTKSDMQRLTEVSARALFAAGLRKNDLVQLTLPMGTAMWQGGLAYYLGCGFNGACVLRFGPGFVDAQISNMRILKPDVIIGSPSFLVTLGTAAAKNNLFRYTRPRLLLTIGENILERGLEKNALGEKLVSVWGAQVRSGYGNTECGMGAFECQASSGHHYGPEFCYVEVVDPETKKQLGDMEEGELIITSLGMSGAPLLRYAISDISFKVSGKCPCGRNSPRIGPILGRTDEQIKIKGVKAYPSDIKNAVLKIKDVNRCFIEAHKDDGITETVKVYVSLRESARIKGRESAVLTGRVAESIRSHLGFSAEVLYASDAMIQEKIFPTGSRKARMFSDLRHKK